MKKSRSDGVHNELSTRPSITLNTDKKAITKAEIDLQASIGKTYNFADDAKPISVANTKGGFNTSFNTDGFEGASKPQGLRGYFYGSEAQYIGGAYYTEDGAGAFITEKQ